MSSKSRLLSLLLATSLLSGLPQLATGQTASGTDPLLTGFESPPNAARPRVWWHWMNGNVTKDGIDADFDWMVGTGIGGVQNFDGNLGTPQVVENRLVFMTEPWKDAFRHAVEGADRRGLEFEIAGSPGWSESGGPWVTPEDAMKKYVWSETVITGGRRFTGRLPQPPSTTGIFQTEPMSGGFTGAAPVDPPTLYADSRVVAYRIDDDALLPTPVVTASGGTLDAAALSDGMLETSAVDLPAAAETGGLSWIRYDYGRPVTVGGVSLAVGQSNVWYRGYLPGERSGTPPVDFKLQASDDGDTWRTVIDQITTGEPQRTVAVSNETARYFRFVSVRAAPITDRPIVRFMRPQSPPPEAIGVRELVLRGPGVVDSFEEKGATTNNYDYFDLRSGTEGGVAPGEVIDITDRMSSDGSLDWTPPSGQWRVLRFGYSLTGHRNGPASPEATGLEVDKLSAPAVRRYIDHYLGLYEDASGGLMGERGLNGVLFDSWEADNANWTPTLIEDFKRLRGYDPVPWMPTLAGHVVGSPQESDLFLFDFRRTLSELVVANHYEQITEVLHERDMIRYGEAHEELISLPGDGMDIKKSADVPMGAMWMMNTPRDVETYYVNDLQETASVAHIYGQNIAGAESLTGGTAFGSTPWDLKSTADLEMIAGINRFMLHTSTHQPLDRGPGLTLGVGQYFTRLETWAPQAYAWIDYLSRASHMLQQGRAASDVLVFYGEAGPVIAPYRDSFPDVPEGFRYDYANADVLLNQVQVRDGRLVTESGMNYRFLFFRDGADYVTLPVLRRMQELVQAGAVLVGSRPKGSPSLADDPAQVLAVLDDLWPQAQSWVQRGEGRVYPSGDMSVAVAREAATADFTYSRPQADTEVMFIHRVLPDGDAYFLSNRRDRPETIEGAFRVTGKVAELWDAATGDTRPATWRIEGDRTFVTVPLDARGSTFVVFRQPTQSMQSVSTPPTVRTMADVEGPWQVAFQADRGAPESVTLPALIDLTTSSDPGVRYFSGEATYRQSIAVPASALRAGSVWLDLGVVHDLVQVKVNGQDLGVVWKPPYRIDISSAAHAGANEVEIIVINTWVNRLIGDVQPGVTQKVTFTLADGRAPDGQPPERFARGLRPPYAADAPLRPSGLIGPVTIQTQTTPSDR